MKIKAAAIAIVIAAGSLTAAPVRASSNDPRPPAEWRMPATARYIGLNSMNKPCWKWWRIVQCVK